MRSGAKARPQTAQRTRPSDDAGWIGICGAADRRAGRPAVLGVPNVPPVGPLRPPAPVLAPPCLANRRCATGHFRMCSFISDWRTSTPHAGQLQEHQRLLFLALRDVEAQCAREEILPARRARRRGRRHLAPCGLLLTGAVRGPAGQGQSHYFLAVEQVVCGWSPHSFTPSTAQLRDFFANPSCEHVGGLAPLRRAGLPDPGARERRGEASSERNRRRHAPAATFSSVATSGMRQQLRSELRAVLRVVRQKLRRDLGVRRYV